MGRMSLLMSVSISMAGAVTDTRFFYSILFALYDMNSTFAEFWPS